MEFNNIMNIVSGKESRYERRGQCDQCGICCRQESCKYFNGKTCDIFGSPDRPLKCKLFPANPPILFDTCGYYFVDKLDDRMLGVKEV